MTDEERLTKLELKVWCQDLIIYQLTSVLQRLRQEQGRELYDEVQPAFGYTLASQLLASGHATASIAPAQMWLFHLDPADPLDMNQILLASAPPSGAPLN